jgi:hypothetical protein
LAIRYDRRVPEELLQALQPGGFAHSLVQYGRSGAYALDLQLRGYAGKNTHWASLYSGLTKVVDLHYLPSKGFKLSAHKTHATEEHKWDPAWETYDTAASWSSRWGAVEDYLELVIVSVGPQHLKEGAVQSAICGFASAELVVIDREAAITFGSQPEKDAKKKATAAPLLAALQRDDAPTWWKSRPTSLGGECDALAINAQGQLWTIEVKPADASTLPWALVQVLHYAYLFRAWGEEDAGATSVLQGMLNQRRKLGLTHGGRDFTVQSPLDVRPVLAFDRGASQTARERLGEVHRHLTAKGIKVDVDMYEVNSIGRLDPYLL